MNMASRFLRKSARRIICTSQNGHTAWNLRTFSHVTGATHAIPWLSITHRRFSKSSPSAQYNSGDPALVGPNDLTRMQQHSLDIYNTAVKSVLPDSMVRRALKLTGDQLEVDGVTYNLNKNVHVMAFGKAVIGMVAAAEEVLGEHISSGVASVPLGIQETLKGLGKTDLLPKSNSVVRILEGAKNNYPDETAHESAQEIYNLASSLKNYDIGLALISGGGSTLLPMPTPPITMDELQELTKLMSLHGATIQEMNIVRKNVEVLKGGGLAKVALPAKVISLILSDVIGDPLGFIASGPTFPNYSSPQQCLDLLRTMGIQDEAPKSIIRHLNKLVLDWPKLKGGASVSDQGPLLLHDCNNVQNIIVGSNKMAARVASERAQSIGYIPYVLSTSIAGEAQNTGIMYAKLADFICHSMGNKVGRDVHHLMQDEMGLLKFGITKKVINDIRNCADDAVNRGKPLCIIGAGETVVNVKGSGVGGRNQELALAVGLQMHETMYNDPVIMKNFQLQFLSGATDGQDGPCDSAGALVDPGLITRAIQQNLSAHNYMDNNDSYNFFAKVDNARNHIMTGLTGTNVMDLQVLLVWPHLWTSFERFDGMSRF